jgi:ubiquinone/menaquinone biosynthesis C-methylase UbiE
MSFDALAPHYRWMEWILAGNKLQRCRVRFLNRIQSAENILILGEGNGRFLLECRRANPSSRITCVDASGAMLASAKARLQRNGVSIDAIDFITADALAWTPLKTYDAIVTHFFLDCFRPDQLAALIAKLSASASPNADWLMADFQAPSAGMRRHRARLILWSMYAFFRFATRLPARRLTAPDLYLRENGFQLQERLEAEWGLLHSDWWARRISQQDLSENS